MMIFWGTATQDGPPLLYQGWLLNEYLSGSFDSLQHIFHFSATYTSWGGVLLSSASLKILNIYEAEKLLQCLHLTLFFAAMSNWGTYLKINPFNRSIWSLVVVVFFWSYGLTKGFYNYLFAFDLVMLALPMLLAGQKLSSRQVVLQSFLWLIACLFQPLPPVLGLMVMVIVIVFQKHKQLKQYIFFIPAILVLLAHFLHIHSETNYTNYSFMWRAKDLLKGLALVSYQRQEFYFYTPVIILMVWKTYVLFKRSGYRLNAEMSIILLLLIVYFIAPQETSGGGLIGFRVAWLMYFFMMVYIFQHSHFGNHPLLPKVTLLVLGVFLACKILVLPGAYQQQNCAIKEHTEYERIYYLTKLGDHTLYAEQLIPVGYHQFQKFCVSNRLITYQNHFAMSDYYPFQYRNKMNFKPDLNKANLQYVIQLDCKFLVIDSIIADKNFRPVCIENSVSPKSDPFFLYERIYAH